MLPLDTNKKMLKEGGEGKLNPQPLTHFCSHILNHNAKAFTRVILHILPNAHLCAIALNCLTAL